MNPERQSSRQRLRATDSAIIRLGRAPRRYWADTMQLRRVTLVSVQDYDLLRRNDSTVNVEPGEIHTRGRDGVRSLVSDLR
jgi:hypothetical protein